MVFIMVPDVSFSSGLTVPAAFAIRSLSGTRVMCNEIWPGFLRGISQLVLLMLRLTDAFVLYGRWFDIG